MSNPYPPPGPENYGQGGYGPDPSATGGQPGYGQPGYGAPQPGYPPQPGYGQQPAASGDDNTFALLTHLLGIVTMFVGALVMYLVKKDTASPYLRHHLLEALNFQITVTIAYVVSWVLAVVTLGILSFVPAIVWIFGLVFSILATVAANKGEWYRYPVSIRMVK